MKVLVTNDWVGPALILHRSYSYKTGFDLMYDELCPSSYVLSSFDVIANKLAKDKQAPGC